MFYITLLHRFFTPQRCYLNCTALSFLFVLLTQLIVSLSTLVNLGGHEALETRYKSEWNSPLNFLNHFLGNSQTTSPERKDFVSMDVVYLIILQFICIVQPKKWLCQNMKYVTMTQMHRRNILSTLCTVLRDNTWTLFSRLSYIIWWWL